MSECRFIVYFEYAERKGEEDEVFNGWPKARDSDFEFCIPIP
jgi:hypothetical protein